MIDLSKIPNNPGCYLFKDNKKKILYIGKAKNLKKRVSSYFNKKDHDSKTKVLVSKIKDIDFIVTKSEVEALILENNLIKKNSPRYNIDLKDSKRYAYLQITDEEFPRLLLARKITGKGKFFGPFVSGGSRDYLREFLTKTFKIRTCNKLPKKVCLRYHLKLCDGPCVYDVKEDYLKNIDAVEKILKGKTREVAKKLKSEMKENSSKGNYEKALILRDQIKSLDWLNEKQVMERQKKYNEDVINFIKDKEKIHLMLFNVRKGILENKQEFEFENEEYFLEEFLVRFYSENPIPKEIIVPKVVDPSIPKYLRKLAKKKVKIIIPKLGEKKDLLELVKKNIEIQYFGNLDNLNELQKKLNLQEIPNVIECFDISHLGGTSTTASMVQFRNGVADKSNYRRFKIKSVEGIDDFRAMAEVVQRRYFGLQKEKKEMPNLIVIDGGIGQLHFAIDELKKLNLKIPIISLAKREEEIYLPTGKILKIDKKNKGLLLLIRIRDEAHRFAIKYNRLLRRKKIRE